MKSLSILVGAAARFSFVSAAALLSLVSAAALLSGAAEKKIRIEDLPPAVQATVREQTRNAALVGLTTEKGKGQVVWEVETRADGKSRDLVLDRNGAVIESEEETDLDSIPAAAKTAIAKRAAGGVIRKVEKVTAGSAVSYEAAVTAKSGRKIEIGVNADGTPHKGD